MDAKELRELIEMISRSSFSIFELEREGFRLRLVKNGAVVATSTTAGEILPVAPAPPPLPAVAATPAAEPAESASPEELERIAQEARADLRELTLRAESLRLLALEIGGNARPDSSPLSSRDPAPTISRNRQARDPRHEPTEIRTGTGARLLPARAGRCPSAGRWSPGLGDGIRPVR